MLAANGARRSRRGIFLITVLFMAVLIAAYAQSVIMLAPMSLTRAGADTSIAAATRAAQSGLDWVRARISSDPRWNASTTLDFNRPGMIVHEGDGQVQGWIRQDQRWSRFRVRFNYQDGPAASAANTDALDNPSTAWSDFPYVSCNNLLGSGSRTAPVAAAGSSYTSPGPWANTQLTVPAATLLLSVEGAVGQATFSGATPTGFWGTPHKKTVQGMLKLSSNQPASNAAIMAAGDVRVQTFGSPLQLAATGAETSRLRSKGNIVVGDVSSDDAELLSGQAPTYGVTTGTRTGSVNTGVDGVNDVFYQIPLSKVREAGGSLALNAGVYVVTDAGQVKYYDMDYAAFASSATAPAGSVVTLPAGMRLVGPNTSGSGPKYRLEITGDLKINATGAATDFAIIPDGGAPQSAAYGGVAATTATDPAAATGTVSSFVSFLGTEPVDDADDSDGWPGNPSSPDLTGAQYSEWNNAISSLSPVGTFSTPDGVNWTKRALPSGGWVATPSDPGHPLRTGGIRPGDPNPMRLDVSLSNHLASLPTSQLGNLYGTYPSYNGTGPSPSTSPSASASPPAATGLLKPQDLELDLQGGSGGITLQNKFGSITIGAQIQGNGSAIVAQEDIALIGTSTDLSSSPGVSLGLNLYAQGKITIDAFKLDSAGGGSFHGVNIKGIMYSWGDINVLAGNTTVSAPFNLQGALIAYGGDPTGAPAPGTAHTTIAAQSANIVYDASYIAGLVNGGPFTLKVVSWHEF